MHFYFHYCYYLNYYCSIGIMALGSLKCIGSATHLKSIYGKGFTMTVNLFPFKNQQDETEAYFKLDNFIINTIGRGKGQKINSINKTRKYCVPKESNSSISELFSNMENMKKELHIREWGLTMTTLEEVFVSAVS